MPHFVIGHHPALVRIEQAALAFEPRDEAFYRRGEIVQADRFGTASSGDDGRFVNQIGQVGAGETGGDLGDTCLLYTSPSPRDS